MLSVPEIAFFSVESNLHPASATFRPPQKERFYTKVQDPLTYKAWLQGVWRGRTFVTNGPMLEFQIDGKGIGEEVVLNKPSPLRIAARARFDSSREAVDRLEFMMDGQLVKSFPRESNANEISFQFSYEPFASPWMALRATGRKRDEVAGIHPPFPNPTFGPS